MKKFKTGIWIIFLLAVSHIELSAQAFWRNTPKTKDIGYIAVDGSIGIANYFGDLNPLAQYASTDITATRPSFSVGLIRKYSPRLLVRAGFSWNRLTANDFKAADPTDERHRYRYIRNAHFRNTVYEASLVAMYDLRPSRFVYYKRMNYTPYLLFGVAGFYHNPRAKTPDGKWTALRPLRTEGQGLTRQQPGDPKLGSSYGKMYSNFQLAFPVGLGVRFKVNDRVDLSFDVAYRILFTDYIDDVSRDYANPSDLFQHNPLSVIMADRTLEPTDARTGGDRTGELVRLKDVLDVDPNDPFAGFGNDGDKRGERNNVDMYIVTGVHLSYILGVGLKCPKFR